MNFNFFIMYIYPFKILYRYKLITKEKQAEKNV